MKALVKLSVINVNDIDDDDDDDDERLSKMILMETNH